MINPSEHCREIVVPTTFTRFILAQQESASKGGSKPRVSDLQLQRQFVRRGTTRSAQRDRRMRNGPERHRGGSVLP
jgi:hypothetical protein